jgi:hypothetical protein
MSATASSADLRLDLGTLRRFVTLVDIRELAARTTEAVAYLATFTAEDDASLLIYAPTQDAAGAYATVTQLLAEGGVGPDDCADIKLCLVDDSRGTLDLISRHCHATVSEHGGGWLPVSRPAYPWSGAWAQLREQAERLWGRRTDGAPYSYEAAIAHIVTRGWTTERHARGGSSPEPSLQRAAEAIEEHFPAGGVRLLHVGNFVGVSLSYLTSWTRGRGGLVVSVDPDIPHRGVDRPQRAVCDLMDHFGLGQGHLLVCGYSLEKSFSNDSVVFEDYDPAAAWASESAPEWILPGLAQFGHRFEVAFMDGNHDPAYLRREIAAITKMLVPGGLLVLDDVDDAWEQIRAVFDEVGDGDWPLDPVCADGRIGILRRSA